MTDQNIKFTNYYFILIFFKTFLFVSFVTINTTDYSFTSTVAPIVDYSSDIALMGQFNYINNNISTWANTWSKHIKNIVIATPENTPKQDLKMGSYLFYKGDNGHYSPYINMGRVIRENNNIRGLLYVHDDLLITGSILRKIGGSEWVSSVEFHKASKNDKAPKSVRIFQNGTFISDYRDVFSGRKYFRHVWGAWKQCHNSFMNMFDDPRFQPYLSEPESENSFFNASFGPSDMLYVYFDTDEQRSAFLDLVDLFADNKLFLECAIPTLVSLMQQRFGVKVHVAILCTDWYELRGNPKKLIGTCLKKGVHEIFHPIKISENSDWSRIFNHVIKL